MLGGKSLDYSMIIRIFCRPWVFYLPFSVLCIEKNIAWGEKHLDKQKAWQQSNKKNFEACSQPK